MVGSALSTPGENPQGCEKSVSMCFLSARLCNVQVQSAYISSRQIVRRLLELGPRADKLRAY